MTDEMRLFRYSRGSVPARQHANGGGWVAETATVDESAFVAESAEVYDEATVGAGARIMGGADIFERAHIGPGVTVSGYIRGDAVVSIDPEEVRVGEYDWLLMDNAAVSGTYFSMIDNLKGERIIELARRHQKKAESAAKRKMSERMNATIKSLETEAVAAAWRTAAKQLSQQAARGLSLAPQALPFDPCEPVGQAAVSYALGMALAQVPVPGLKKEHAVRLALELRVLGLAGLTDTLADTLVNAIGPALKALRLPGVSVDDEQKGDNEV